MINYNNILCCNQNLINKPYLNPEFKFCPGCNNILYEGSFYFQIYKEKTNIFFLISKKNKLLTLGNINDYNQEIIISNNPNIEDSINYSLKLLNNPESLIFL